MTFVITSPILLNNLDGLEFFSVTWISNSGEIVGYGGHITGQDKIGLSLQSGSATGLSPSVGYDFAEAYGVNDSGVVAGISLLKATPWVTQAVEWQNGAVRALPDIGNGGAAWAVNSQGQVAGYVLLADGFDGEAVVWTNGKPTLLGFLPGDSASGAAALNDAGQVVGSSGTDSSTGGHAFLWQNGAMTDLGTLSGGTSSQAMSINKSGQIVGFGTDSKGVQQAILWVNGAATALPGLASGGSAEADAINDNGQIVGYATTAAGVKHAVIWQNGQIIDLNSLLSGTSTVLNEAYSINDSGQIVAQETYAPAGPIVAVTFSITNTPTALTAQSAVQAYQSNPQISAELVSDSAANVLSSLAGLEAIQKAGKLLGITLTDPALPAMTVTQAQFDDDRGALNAISSHFKLTVTGATANEAGVLTLDNPNVVSATVSDSAQKVSVYLSDLAFMVDWGQLTGITLTDAGTPTISLTAAQLVSDLAAVRLIQGNFNLSIDATQPDLTIQGYQTGGHGNTVQFHGSANEYGLAATGNGQSLTVTDIGTGRSSVDTLTGINALQFSDMTVITATAPSSHQVTSGNITELYGAVFGRVPDVGGLSFYENFLTTNPNTSLFTFAQWFLQSSEYRNNPANAYTPDAAGDTAFITDLYSKLLHRAPQTGDTSFYETNAIAPLLKGLTAGTAAYNDALAMGRATVVTYFSQSPEFLTDVQITVQHPASSQHWLMLI